MDMCFFFSSFPHEHSAYFLMGLLMPWWAGSVSWSSPCWRWIHCFSPFVFVQVFGDYYHFRHHAVEKRALSGHRGMHIRLQKEPQVRLLSALTVLIAATKGQKTDWITRNVCVCVSQEKGMAPSMTARQTLDLLQSTPVLPSVPLTQSETPRSCKYAKYILPNKTTAGSVSVFGLSFSPVTHYLHLSVN